jgi:hypothetical protein
MAKFVLKPAQVATSQDMGSSFEVFLPSSLQADVVGVQLNYTSGGSPVGTLEIQGSVDGDNYASLYLNINGASGLTVPIPANSSPIVVDLYGSALPFLKLKYTRASGTGTMNIFFTYKRLGD